LGEDVLGFGRAGELEVERLEEDAGGEEDDREDKDAQTGAMPTASSQPVKKKKKKERKKKKAMKVDPEQKKSFFFQISILSFLSQRVVVVAAGKVRQAHAPHRCPGLSAKLVPASPH
jgi:hypothetical protein